jgi:hypothetical protein
MFALVLPTFLAKQLVKCLLIFTLGRQGNLLHRNSNRGRGSTYKTSLYYTHNIGCSAAVKIFSLFQDAFSFIS